MTCPVIQDWLFAREMLRRLGFSPDELFFVVSASGKIVDRASGLVTVAGGPVIGLTLRAQDKEFNWTIGATELALADIEAAYAKACDEWNGSNPDLDGDLKALRESRPFQERIGLAAALVERGFTFRRPVWS